MDTTLSDRILKDVRIRCPGVLDDVIIRELYNVAMEFTDVTDAWKEDLTFNTVANRKSYELDSASAEVTRLRALVNDTGTGVSATMDEPGTVVLLNAPSTVQTLTATVAYKVNEADTSGYPVLPDWIVSKWLQVFVAGVLAGLMAQPAKPYSNPTLAVYYLRRYRDGMATARAQADHSNLFGGQSWRFPSVAPARRK